MGLILLQLHDRHDVAVEKGFPGVSTALRAVRPLPLPEPLTQIQHTQIRVGWLAGTHEWLAGCWLAIWGLSPLHLGIV